METAQKDFTGSLKDFTGSLKGQEATDSHAAAYNLVLRPTFLYQQHFQWIVGWRKIEWRMPCVWGGRMLEWGENNHVSRNGKWAFRGQGEWAESQSLILMFLVSNVTSLSAYFLVANFSPLIKYDGECKEWGRQSEWGGGIPTKLQSLLLL